MLSSTSVKPVGLRDCGEIDMEARNTYTISVIPSGEKRLRETERCRRIILKWIFEGKVVMRNVLK